MTDPNNITPPPELVRHWWDNTNADLLAMEFAQAFATQAARWGADQEMEGCVKWIEDQDYHPCVAKDLRAARRPRPEPTLKEQALAALDSFEGFTGSLSGYDTIRRALALVPEGPAVTPAADARGLGSVAPDDSPVATPVEEYHEDMGPVTWWRFPIDEPPWVGSPNDSDWPGYHTHFTPQPPIPQGPEPAAAFDRPLWELMRDAYAQADADRGGMAAELRVVADWLVYAHNCRGAAAYLRAEAYRAEAERAEVGE
jgi:hypothetical protein